MNVSEKAVPTLFHCPFHENASSSSFMSSLALCSIHLGAEREITVPGFIEEELLLMMCQCTDVLLCKAMKEKIIFHVILCMKIFRRGI